MSEHFRLRNLLGSIEAGTTGSHDNLAIAIATYFDGFPKPENDEHNGELGWSQWVIDQTNATLDAIAEKAIEELGNGH